MLSQSVQDYLKAIYKLQEKGVVSTTEIAKELGVSGASVTGMLKRLSTMGVVDYNSYKGVKLTDGGEKIALEIIRHHRLLELYLKEHLGFSLEKVHDEACRLEHYISEEFADKISELLNNPVYDPHGHSIPDKQGKINKSLAIPLNEVEVGQRVVIRILSDEDPKLLAYLEEIGLVPNANVEIQEKAPFKGPITITHNGNSMIVGNEVAMRIFVEIVD